MTAHPSQLREIADLREGLLEDGQPMPAIVDAIVERFGVALLKAQRLARGWTRRRAVERVLATYDEDGLARPSLNEHRLRDWEHRRARPGEDYLDRLCRVYETRPDRLGYGRDYTPSCQSQPTDRGITQSAVTVCEADGRPYPGVPAALLAPADGEPQGDDGAGESHLCGKEVDVNREQFLRGMGGAGLAALLGGAADASVRLSLKLGASNLAPVTVEQLQLRVAEFVRDHDHVPSDRLLARVFDQYRQVEALLDGGQRLSQRRMLHRVAGQLSFLLGSLSFELGDYAGVGTHLLTAGQLAQEVGDHRLVGWVRTEQSTAAFWAGDFQEALRCAQDGQRYARGDGEMSSRLAARCEARAYARMGERGGVVDALRRAERALPRQPSSGTDGWWAFTPADLERNTALSLLWAGRPEDAEPHARQAITAFASALPTQPCPDQALATMTLATCLVRQNRPDEGLALADEIDLGGREANLRHARELLAALNPRQRSLPAACEFADRLRGVCASRLALSAG